MLLFFIDENILLWHLKCIKFNKFNPTRKEHVILKIMNVLLPEVSIAIILLSLDEKPVLILNLSWTNMQVILFHKIQWGS